MRKLLVATVTSLAALALVACPRQPRKPNLLLIVVDCLRGDALSVVGYPRETTPNIDALARQGTRFTHAYSQASWTRPSLPTILTGLYPSEHGLLDLESDPNAPSAALDDSVLTLAERLKGAGYATAMVGEQHQLSPKFGLQQGFDLWQPKAAEGANINRRVLEWQAGLPKGKPFFAYLHYLELHFPYCPPKDLRGRFDEGPSRLNVCADWRQLRDDIRSGKYVVTPADRQLLRARYDEELLGVDALIGQLVAELDRRDLYDDTLILVTGDHGEEFGEHGSYFHGQSLYNELLHVPLVWKPPASWDAPRGQVVDGLAEQRNAAATFLDAAGVRQLPAGTHTLGPWIRGERRDAPNRYTVSEGVDQIAINEGRWKMIVGREGAQTGGGFQLYDLDKDPGEQKNLAEGKRTRLALMRQLLASWRKGLHPAPQKRVTMDTETHEGLKNLGYVH
ncbi:MAG TPA: sulfatase [Thermoanaerobaculia bacterium]|jgi:arylsulfatase A-like enzyme|nr:sulfatase [Thermoanaerobaculia bacterium]